MVGGCQVLKRPSIALGYQHVFLVTRLRHGGIPDYPKTFKRVFFRYHYRCTCVKDQESRSYMQPDLCVCAQVHSVVSDSLQPHVPQGPACCPVLSVPLPPECVLSHFSHVRLCATPWTAARQAPLSMGILQARILEWVAMPFSRVSS